MICFLSKIHCAWLGWNVFSEGTEKWTQWYFLCEAYSRQQLKGHCSCLTNSCRHGETTPDLILWQTACETLSWMPFNRTKHSPVWFGEHNQCNGHNCVVWARVCRRRTFLTSNCHTELSPIYLSASLNSGAYLGNFVIVFGSSSNTNMFGVASTCVNSSPGGSDALSWPLGLLPHSGTHIDIKMHLRNVGISLATWEVVVRLKDQKQRRGMCIQY